MKSLIQAVVIAAVLAAPVASFAQSNQPVTRAQVRAELVQLEKAGYQPGHADPHYPADIQAAQARVDAQNGAAQPAASAFGRKAVPSKVDEWWKAVKASASVPLSAARACIATGLAFRMHARPTKERIGVFIAVPAGTKFWKSPRGYGIGGKESSSW